MHLLQGKEVRSVYFVFVHTKSLLKDGHSKGSILILYLLRVRVHYFPTWPGFQERISCKHMCNQAKTGSTCTRKTDKYVLLVFALMLVF